MWFKFVWVILEEFCEIGFFSVEKIVVRVGIFFVIYYVYFLLKEIVFVDVFEVVLENLEVVVKEVVFIELFLELGLNGMGLWIVWLIVDYFWNYIFIFCVVFVELFKNKYIRDLFC